MADRMLYLAYASSILGLLLIAYVGPQLNPPVSEIGSLSARSLEKKVRVEGWIEDFHVFSGGSMLLDVADGTGNAKVYVPYSVAESLDYAPRLNDTVTVSGVLRMYRGTLELYVEQPQGVMPK